MNALDVVVLDVLREQTSPLILAEHHHVIEQLAADSSDDPLGRGVLKDCEGLSVGIGSEARARTSYLVREERVVVEDQIPMARRVGEGLP